MIASPILMLQRVCFNHKNEWWHLHDIVEVSDRTATALVINFTGLAKLKDRAEVIYLGEPYAGVFWTGKKLEKNYKFDHNSL